MKKLYLDYNVISYFRTRNFPKGVFFEQENIIDILKEKYSIPFSPAHLEDIAASKMRCNSSDQIIQDEIKFLTLLAENHSMRRVTMEKLQIYYDELPIDCYKRVVEQYYVNDWAGDVEKEVLSIAHKNENSSPIKINNTPSNKILIDYKERIISITLKNLASLNVNDIDIKKFLNFNEIKERFDAVEMYINVAANILEEIGYYREHREKYRSRMHDVSHIIYGAYCDIFVSEDKKIRKKAQAIYSSLNISTRVISLTELKEELDI